MEWGIYNPQSKRGSNPLCDWAHLDQDALYCIFKLLSIANLCRAKAVCSWWNRMITIYIKRSESSMLSREVPWLLYVNELFRFCKVYNLEENVFHTCSEPVKVVEIMDNNHKSACFGSSYGWLIYIDRHIDAFLLNPFTRTRVQLPRIGSPLELPDYVIAASGPEHYFGKAILSSDPSNYSRQGTHYFVILMYHGNYGRGKLAFHKSGCSSWTKLDGCEHGPYVDITCHEEKLYALGRNNGSIEVWHLLQDCLLPVKKVDMSELGFKRMPGNPLNHYYLKEIRVYLVAVAAGDLLLVIKYLWQIASFFGQDDHLKMPQVETFKLDPEQKVWVEVDSLGGGALFLGINDSISLDSKEEGKVIQPDAIYFTDNDWYRDRNGLYKGYCIFVWDHKANRFTCLNVYGGEMMVGQYPVKGASPRRTIWVAPHPW